MPLVEAGGQALEGQPLEGQALEGAGLPPYSFPVEYFRRALGRGRLSHAYLFLGQTGSGRRRLARELAKAVFCRAGSPCGACPSCRAVDHGNHAGVFVYTTQDKKSSVEIGEVRELSSRIHLRRADFLVAIIEDADRLTMPAANALLKTLEEPTGTALLLLIAGSSGALLPTIVSRCHRIPFPAPSPERPGPEPAGSQPGPTPEVIPFERIAADAAAPGFYAETDPKEWLATLFPGDAAQRENVRRLVQALLAGVRGVWSPPQEGGASDPVAERLEELLEIGADLDRSVHPDLLLEAAVRTARRLRLHR